MLARQFTAKRFIVTCVALVVLQAGVSSAHVMLDTPNGDEQLTVGSEYVIRWHPAPAHPMGDWDLWYSSDGNTGTWKPIIMDLYPGDTTPTGVELTYDWTVPDDSTDMVRVLVVQEGLSGTWDDVSDADLSIVPMLGGDADRDGFVGFDDLSIVLASWGLDTVWGNGEFTNDNVVDGDDLDVLLENWQEPEPPADLVADIAPVGAPNGIVDGADLGALLARWKTSDPVADIAPVGSPDGIVDGADLGALLARWKNSYTTLLPEPSTLSLLAFAGVGLLRRRSARVVRR